jgi:hypothetical protein
MDAPPDLTTELWKALDSTIGKLAGMALSGVVGWFLRRGWEELRTRPRRGFWAPFFEGALVVVIGHFPGAELFEGSGLVGTGDAFAFGELASFFHTIGQPTPVLVGGDTADPRTLRSNLVCIGGPDVNLATRTLLAEIATSLEFGDPDRHEIWTKDPTSQRIFAPRTSPNAPDEVASDYCVLVKARNPYDRDKRVLLVFGGFGSGTWAGAKFLASDNLWKTALTGTFPPVGWFHRIWGLIRGRYSGLPDSFECVIEARVKTGTPLSPVSAFLRGLAVPQRA